MPRLAPRRGVIAKALLGGAAAGLVGGVAALGTALGSLSVAWTALQAAAQLAPPRPESFWPTAVLPYLTAAVALTALWKSWRQREAETLTPLRKEIADAVQHFKEEIGRVERDTLRHVDGSLAAMQRGITGDINGWSRRIEVVERGHEQIETFDESVVRFMAESETDRRSIKETLTRFEKLLEREGQERASSERRIIDAINARIPRTP